MFRGFLGLVATVIVVGLLVSVGAGIYQAGLTQGVIDAGRFPAGGTVPIPGYGYGWHGPDLFGLLFGLFFLFILFGIIRAAFFGGRGRGWGHHGYGAGPWGKGYGSGEGPGAWRADRDSRIAEWHRRLHEEEAGPAGTPGSGSSGSSAGSSGGGAG